MRPFYAVLVLLACCAAYLADAATNAVLPASEYDPAAAAFWLFVQPPSPKQERWRTNLVYCLSYGRSNSPLPADFMARFVTSPLKVITDTNALQFAANGAISERG